MIPPLHLITALIAVESGGNPHAVGDSGAARGCLQIRKEVVTDVNHILRHMEYDWAVDCDDRSRSVQICCIYLDYYCTRERLGRKPTNQDFARVWNGGPDGWRHRSTCKYWREVKWVMRRQQVPDMIPFTPPAIKVP